MLPASITPLTEPKRTASPATRLRGDRMRSPLTQVPFDEPEVLEHQRAATPHQRRVKPRDGVVAQPDVARTAAPDDEPRAVERNHVRAQA